MIGDWNGDGTDEIGLYNDGQFYLDWDGNGVWDKTPTDVYRNFGINSIRSTAQPVIGNWSFSSPLLADGGLAAPEVQEKQPDAEGHAEDEAKHEHRAGVLPGLRPR